MPHAIHSRKVMGSRTMSRMVSNIVDTVLSATPAQESTGAEWYSHANFIASAIAHGTEYTTREIAGIIAALSPQTKWEDNVRLAIMAVKNGRASGHINSQIAKADAILQGMRPEDILNGQKETAFFHNIAEFDSGEFVTIDRHAHDIAVGERFGNEDRGLSAQNRYRHISRAYRIAGEILGMPAHHAQAIAWQVWTGRDSLVDIRGALQALAEFNIAS